MSQNLCKLCLFKSEPEDEIVIEESQQLQQIIDELFSKMVSLTRTEIHSICPPCREKLKSFYEYYKFVLENQKTYEQNLISVPPYPLTGVSRDENTEFIEVVKAEPVLGIAAKSETETTEVLNWDAFRYHDEDYQPGCTEYSETEDEMLPKKGRRTKKKKYPKKPKRYVEALQKQKSDFIRLLYDFDCYICQYQCQLKFTSFQKLQYHYKKLHKVKKVWTCCGKEMKLDVELIEHAFEHKHTWKCEPCAIEFKTIINLWRHNSETHSEASKIPLENPRDWKRPQYTCDLCGERMTSRVTVRRHMYKAHIKTYIVCQICGESSENQKEATKHQETAHSSLKKVPCTICGLMITNNPYRMTAHIKNKHEKQQRICPYCGKIFANNAPYRSHMSAAHNPPKHKCRYCGKEFRKSDNCKDHEATHTGIARYHCEMCGAPFKSAGNYSAHKRKLHPQEYAQQKIDNLTRKYQSQT